MWTKRKAINEAEKAMHSYKEQAHELSEERAQVANQIQLYKAEHAKHQLLLASAIVGSQVNEDYFSQLAQFWNFPQLLHTYHNLLDQRATKIKERDTLLRDPTIINRHNLVESSDARLLKQLQHAQETEQQVRQELSVYKTKAFDWLYSRDVHRKKESSGFVALWKMVTLQKRKQKHYLEDVEGHFGRPFRQIANNFESLTQQLNDATGSVKQASQDYQDALSLLHHFDTLERWDRDFDGIVTSTLAETLATLIQQTPTEKLNDKVTSAQRIHVAAMHANEKKIEYATNLQHYLEQEEQDRLQRVSSIGSVRNKWRRNPSGYVRGDKSKWLQTIPQMKSQGTRKRISWSHSMRNNLSGFSDYHSYSHHYFHHHHYSTGFIAFDIFNSHCEYRMPYEGFSSNIVPELEEFREEHGDKGWLDHAGEQVPEELDSEQEGLDPSESSEGAAGDQTDADIAGAAAAMIAAGAIAEEIEEGNAEDFDDAS